MNALLPTAFLCSLAAASLLADPPAPSKVESDIRFPSPKNAALTYWQAFALMPQLSETDKELLLTSLGPKTTENPTPFNTSAAEALLTHFPQSLTLYEEATRLPCDWGLDYSKGVNLGLPHISKLLELTKSNLLRARLRIHQGNAPAALADLQSALRASYQISSGPPFLIENLLQLSMQDLCFHAIAADFSKWDNASLEKLEKTLNSLPQRNTTLMALKTERSILLRDLPAYLSQYKGMFKLEQDDSSPAVALKQFVESLLADPEKLQQATKQFDADFLQLIRLHELPYREVHCEIDEFFDQLSPKDGQYTLSFLILPMFNAVRTREMIASIQFTMLKAAIAIRLNGPKALAQYPDPFDSKPFQYKRKGDDFILTSELRYKDKPFSIHFR